LLGAGGAVTGAGTANNGGNGGAWSLTSGAGGNASGGTANTGGNGGNISLIASIGGTGTTANGTGGVIALKGASLAASTSFDVTSNTTATRTAGGIHDFQNNGTTKFQIDFNGKVVVPTGGGADTAGRSVLVLGTVTVSTTAVTANSVISLTNCVPGGTALGLPTVGTVSAGTSFVINSETTALAVQTLDTSTICWRILN
jgi:hypothetical protein